MLKVVGMSVMLPLPLTVTFECYREWEWDNNLSMTTFNCCKGSRKNNSILLTVHVLVGGKVAGWLPAHFQRVNERIFKVGFPFV